MALVALSTGIVAGDCLAHQGPPYPLLVDRTVGPWIVSVWADPDVGVGTFFVMLDPAPGVAPPGETGVEVRVQPSSGRLPEAGQLAPAGIP